MPRKSSYQRNKSKGLCGNCGKEKENNGKATCNLCIDRGKRIRAQPSGRLSHLRHEAKRRGLKLEITEEEIADIEIPELCPLLGIPLIYNGHIHSLPSFDRKDNSKGYTKDNIWVISAQANLIKRDATIEELKAFAKNILIHFS